MTNLFNKSLISALSFLFVMAFSPITSAAENPFGMSDMDASQITVAEKGKCGEGKCGGNKPAEKKGKCGAGKCGGNKSADKKGKCGDGKSADKKAKCGAGMSTDKKSKSKCGGK